MCAAVLVGRVGRVGLLLLLLVVGAMGVRVPGLRARIVLVASLSPLVINSPLILIVVTMVTGLIAPVPVTMVVAMVVMMLRGLHPPPLLPPLRPPPAVLLFTADVIAVIISIIAVLRGGAHVATPVVVAARVPRRGRILVNGGRAGVSLGGALPVATRPCRRFDG